MGLLAAFDFASTGMLLVLVFRMKSFISRTARHRAFLSLAMCRIFVQQMVAKVALLQSLVVDDLFATPRLCTIPAQWLITPIAKLAGFAAPLLQYVCYSLSRRRGTFSGLTSRGSDGGRWLTSRGILVTAGHLGTTLATAVTAAAAAGALTTAVAAATATSAISFAGV